MSTLRFRVVEKAFQAKPVEVAVPSGTPERLFRQVRVQPGEDVQVSAHGGLQPAWSM